MDTSVYVFLAVAYLVGFFVNGFIVAIQRDMYPSFPLWKKDTRSLATRVFMLSSWGGIALFFVVAIIVWCAVIVEGIINGLGWMVTGKLRKNFMFSQWEKYEILKEKYKKNPVDKEVVPPAHHPMKKNPNEIQISLPKDLKELLTERADYMGISVEKLILEELSMCPNLTKRTT